MQAEGYYKNDLMDSVWRTWSREGILREELRYKNGKRHGLSRHWHSTGALQYEINYADGKEQGEYKRWEWNGNLLEISHYHAGQLHGERVTYWPDGTIHEKGRYEHDKKIGAHITRNADRATDSMIYTLAGELAVTYKKYKNGKIASISRYKNGELSGKKEEWDHRGTKEYEGNYVDGKRDGNHTYYFGSTKKVEVWKNGEFIETLTYEKGKFQGKSDEQQYPILDFGGVEVYDMVSEGSFEESPDEPLIIKAILPTFPGGEEAMQKWIANHFDYPKKRNKAVIKGRTLLTITLSETGTVESVEKVFPREEACIKDYEAILKTMPAWEPVIRGSMSVKSRVNILVNCY
jgi:antitoxin component YwqK of YwqJK toxin-antitoxin module